jgi:hypothetical protein
MLELFSLCQRAKPKVSTKQRIRRTGVGAWGLKLVQLGENRTKTNVTFLTFLWLSVFVLVFLSFNTACRRDTGRNITLKHERRNKCMTSEQQRTASYTTCKPKIHMEGMPALEQKTFILLITKS